MYYFFPKINKTVVSTWKSSQSWIFILRSTSFLQDEELQFLYSQSLRPILPILHTQHSPSFRCDCPAFRVLRLQPPPWRSLSLCESLVSWKSDQSYGLCPQKKKNWPNYTHQIIHNLRELAPGSQCPCNSEGLTGSDPHYWLMLNWLTTETQLRISAKANLSSPHIC